MMKIKQLVPKKRFKEFENDREWEENKLGDIVDFLDGQRKPLKSGARESGPYPYYGASGIIDYVKGYIFNEELILLSEDGANIIDRNYRVSFLAHGKYWVNNHAHVLKAKIDYSNGFICESLEKINYEKYNTGTAQPKLNQEVCRNINLMIPELDEQKKIFAALDNLDNLINLQQCKLAKIKDLKSAYLSDLFPKKGEKYPKIRFEGFTEAWEQKRIRDIFRVTRGNVLAATKTVTEKTEKMLYPVYSSQTKNNGLMGYYNDYLFDNAITWTTDGANAGTVNYRPGKFYSTNVNGVLLSEDGYVNKAVAEALNSEAWKHVSHVGNPKLMNNIMSDIEISLSTEIEELNKISVLLDKIDQRIEFQEQKLVKLEKLKQAYLNEMFV